MPTASHAARLACVLSALWLPALWLPAPARGADAPVESQADLQKMFDDRQYKELVPKLSRALTAKGPAAADYDRHALLELKAEASVHLHAKSGALDAFKQAAAATTDKDAVKRDTAAAVLCRECGGNMTYVPRTGTPKGEKPEPIDIVEPDSRKNAYQALEADLLAKAKPRVAAAKNATALRPIMDAARSLGDLRAVEFVTDGGDGDVSALLGDLGNRVCKLLNADLDVQARHLSADWEVIGSKSSAAAQRASIGVLIRDTHAGEAEIDEVHDVSKQMPTVFGTVTDFKPTEEQAADLHKQIEVYRKDLRDKGWGD